MIFPLVLMAGFSISLPNSYLFPFVFLFKIRDLYHLLSKSKRNERPSNWVVRNIFSIVFEYIGIAGASFISFFYQEYKIYAMLIFGVLAALPKLIGFLCLLTTTNVSPQTIANKFNSVLRSS
jgi:hypothetical protein